MKRKVKDLLKRVFLRFHRLGVRLGFYVVPVHYYSPVPNLLELEKTRDQWARKSELPGLPVDLDAQVRNLRTICLPYQKEYAGNRSYREAVAQQLGPGYGYIEAQALHGVVRHYQPRRVIEVGSGVSIRCSMAALELNRNETGRPWRVTCIEPFPSAALRALTGIELIEQPVQAVPFEVFRQLGENDLLFIDSSHAVKVGSDVNHLILEVLPRLRSGVLVHFHDINLPYDYARGTLQDFLHPAEVSLLRAFLIFNPKARIVFCLSHLHYERQEALKEVFPEYDPQADSDGLRDPRYRAFETPAQHFPSSLYLQIQ